MYRLCSLILLLVYVNHFIASSVPKKLELCLAQFFSDYEIVPDVISVAPTEYMSVKFPSGVEAHIGNVLTPTLVKDRPTVSWNADPDLYYTVVDVDPDVPSRAEPTQGQLVHWVVGNVPGDNVACGDPLWEYFGSGPAKDSGLHRYVQLVYQQPAKLEFDEPRMPNTTDDNRYCFSIENFAKKYNLGDPIAGNFYQAQYDDYVPILYEILGVNLKNPKIC